MDAQLSSNVVAFLQSRERGPPVRTTEILNNVGRKFQKRDVNRVLYSLQRKGMATKVSEVPPMWQWCERGSRGTSPFDRRERARPRGMATKRVLGRGRGALGRNQFHSPQQPLGLATAGPTTHSDVESRLLEVLQMSPLPQTAADLGRSCQSLPQTDILTALSRMQRNGSVKKVVSGDTCTWALISSAGDGEPLRVVSEVSTAVQRQAPPPLHKRAQSMPVRAASFAAIEQERTPPSPGGLEDSLLKALSRAPKPVTALEMAKSLGFPSRSSVNPTLYKMAKEGLVELVSGAGPPRWRSLPIIELSDTLQVQQQPPYTETLSVASDSGSPLDSMETDSRGYEDEEAMDEQDSPYQVDLSAYSESDVAGRVMAILQAYPTKLLTSLDLAQASKTGRSRAEVDTILRQLENSGSVGRTSGRFPTLWGLPNNPELAQQSSLVQPPVMQPPQQHQSRASPLPLRNAVPVNHPMHTAASSQSGEQLMQAVADLNRNPVSTLQEYCQSNKVELSFPTLREFGPPHRKHFVVGAVFGDLVFESESLNKKDAKRAVAEKALQHLRAHQMIGLTRPSTLSRPSTSSSQCPQTVDLLGTSFHDGVARLAHEMYAALENKSPIPLPGRKVIACFIMEDLEHDSMTVVSFGSGTRCITGDQLSLRGDVVNDSHAEVVARRGLVRFLYQQLLAFHGKPTANGDFGTIFEAATEENGLVSVKDSIRFHLYISTAPCGDGAQFSREDQENRVPSEDGDHRPTMQSKLQGLLRTKMEGGEGTIPMGDAQLQTWDGILQGGRLRTMSCSDKVGRWNVLGLQGALLSLFVCPVYMSSLTLGSLHHHGHLSRAVCCRFGDLATSLPEHFKVNHPLLGRIQGGDEMKRHVEKTSNHCMNWAAGDDIPEVTVGPVGRPVSQPHASPPPHSKVCKAELYAMFLSLCKLTNRTDLLGVATYQEAKLKATRFQEAKSLLYKLCETKGYGMWMKKPPEQEMFGPSVLEQLNIGLS